MTLVQLNPEFVSMRIRDLMVIDFSISTEDNWTLDNFLLELPEKWNYSFVEVENEVMLGFIVCSKVNDSNLHIHRLAVGHDYQNKGVGTGLLNSVLIKARCRRFIYTTLKVSLSNICAQKFYEKNNFYLDYLEGANMVYRRII